MRFLPDPQDFDVCAELPLPPCLLVVAAGKAQQEFEQLGSLHGEGGLAEGSNRAKRYRDIFEDNSKVTSGSQVL